MKMPSKLHRDLLDAVRDDAYGLEEIWSLGRGDGIDEQAARALVRDALLELERDGYIRFAYEVEPGKWRDLGPDEVAQLQKDSAEWGIGSSAPTRLQVTTTAKGDAALRG